MTGSSLFDEDVTPELLTELGVRRIRHRELNATMRQHLEDIHRAGCNTAIFEVIATRKVLIVAHHGPQPTARVLRDCIERQTR